MRQPGTTFFAAEVRQQGSLNEVSDILIQAGGKIFHHSSNQRRGGARTDRVVEEYRVDAELVGSRRRPDERMDGDGRLAIVFLLPRPVQQSHSGRCDAGCSDIFQDLQPHARVDFFRPNHPIAREIPPTPNVTEMLKDYKGEAPIAAGEAFDPSPSNIESRTDSVNRGPDQDAPCFPRRRAAKQWWRA